MTPDFTSDDEGEFLRDFADFARQIRDIKIRFYQSLERAIVSQLEIIEGHMPSNAEIGHHASRYEDPNGTHIQISWKGEVIVDGRVSIDVENNSIGIAIAARHKVDLTEEIVVDLD